MAPLAVHIKHAGKTHDVELDPDLPPVIFKDAVYQVTGVPVERMKVMVKGGVLKDDSNWAKIGPKAGQTFMVIGAAGELPKPPEKPIVFLEDLDDSELAEALSKPVGLKNLGNTCYMNATVQALRAVPELQQALTAPALQSTTPLPGALRDLYQNMGKTTDNITPMQFLSTLRQVNPQFAEMDRREKSALMMGGYAQQGIFIIQTLRNVPGLTTEGTTLATSAQAEVGNKRFVEQYLMGEMQRELSCDEAPEEPASITSEQVLKVECNIIANTNYMLAGIMNSLDQKIEKNSPSLGRSAVYSQKSRMSRLPSYLTVHMVRFAWRADIGKKAKIMRKVKFPTEFDALDLVTDNLKNKLIPASRKLKEVEKERGERRKVRKRTKAVATSTVTKNTPAPPAAEAAASTGGDVTMADAGASTEEEEKDPDVKKDIGASQTGLYDLVAIVTHKGAAADAGHYIAFVKKSVFHSAKGKTSPVTGATGQSVELDEDDEDWYKFDDDKVSIFPKEKLATLDGGGEDSSATTSMVLPSGDSSPALKTLPSMVLQQETGWKMQKSHSDLAFPRPVPRSRGYSESRMREFASVSKHSLSRLSPNPTLQPEALAPAATVVPSSSYGSRVSDTLTRKSSLRNRSVSVSQVTELKRVEEIPASPSGGPGFWWSLNRREVTARPWNDGGEIDDSMIPDEQKENWEQTRKTVSQAIGNVLGVATLVAHKTLIASVPLLELVPVPGLTMAAKLLLNIWDAVQEVDTNRLVFLRLTERCACVVITLNQELQDAGELVVQELSPSLRRIEDLFSGIQVLTKKESNIPFLKRYLKREETLRHIEGLNRQLDQELQILGPSFQIRTVKVIKEFTAGMDDRIEAAIQRVLQNHCCPQPSPNLNLTHPPKNPSLLRPMSRPMLQPLEEIISVQDDKDRELDQHDLRRQMDNALQSGSDSTMLEFLQIPREDILEAIKSMQRHLERTRPETKGYTETEPDDPKDTLEREFIETGIDSLRRMSKSTTTLPSWTITRFEIDCTSRVGVGFFSDVYEGTWRGQTVAIKVLRDFTSSRLFVREVEIWKNLSHPNIVELLGASSASGNPPWFFVSPFAENGDLGDHLRRLAMAKEQRGVGLSPSFSSSSARTLEHLRRDSFKPSRDSDLYRFMLEIAMGMDYLHEHGVLHGDLKCANVLVDEAYTCLISDFGQSELRAEAFRMSGISESRGTLRWQAPEVMQGLSDLTPAVDVYAFAITCVEVLNMGQMPWSLVDDNAVQFIVLKEDERPAIPSQYHATPIQELLQQCWHRDPESRPVFSEVVLSLRRNRHTAGVLETPPPKSIPEMPEFDHSQEPKSPISLSPCLSVFSPADGRAKLTSRPSFRTVSSSPRPVSDDLLSQGETIVESSAESDSYSPSPLNDSSSTFLSEDSAVSEGFVKIDMEMDPQLWEARNERRYRMSLNHPYHHSLSLALWDPVPVAVGAVGYVLKPSGSFVTLFNAVHPADTDDPRVESIPSIAGYGKVPIGSHRHATRNAALRGLDAVVGFLSSGKRLDPPPKSINRRATFPLRAGHKVAYMYTESTEYRYMRELDAAKAWFRANVDRIVEAFGAEHNVHREDLMLGVLQAPNYALFVSHNHPDGNVQFHTYSSRQGKPWGTFSTDTNALSEHGGPSYREASPTPHQCACKVSINGHPPKALILARLRFPTDATEPTSL
ncbi:hypothetical protein NP233_g1485 [Leucocoprinus birnbaumii]|uniref:ubiquitinyl hydrolase 1 n=1 Tax=Leucocoprinus birnbaumii TaxID=56174 RepID=A0AAD5W318_9AGAR|nr:hypothetical protein NP233_g1485 [Leucocoprinus birnbaumii]